MTLPQRRGIGDQVFSRVAGAPLVRGNKVRLLEDAAGHYPAWLEAIASAKRFVHFENYLFRNDETAAKFADAFLRKAAEGVRIRVVYDWIGSFGFSMPSYWKRLREGGVEVRAFNPPRLDEPFGWVGRDHRKCVVIDDRVAFVTGVCVARSWEADEASGRAAWRDTGIEIRGPAVAEVAATFADSWEQLGAPLPAEDLIPSGDVIPHEGDVELRVVAATPGMAHLYRLDPLVASLAQKTLWLTDAYFAGTALYVQALRAARQDGVDVRLLVPGSGSDLPLMQSVSRAGYRSLLEAGVRVFEWNGPMLHAKTAVADARWARVGSTNLNLLSWVGNRELDVVVENEEFGRQMEAMFERDLANSTEIVLQKWARVRPAQAAAVRMRSGSRRGSGSLAAAGAVRIGNALGSVLAARRVHGPAEARLMLQGGVVLAALGSIGFFFPKFLAWPLAFLCLWMATALVYRAIQRGRRDASKGVKS